MAVKTLSMMVVDGRRPRIGVTGSQLNLSERHACI